MNSLQNIQDGARLVHVAAILARGAARDVNSTAPSHDTDTHTDTRPPAPSHEHRKRGSSTEPMGVLHRKAAPHIDEHRPPETSDSSGSNTGRPGRKCKRDRSAKRDSASKDIDTKRAASGFKLKVTAAKPKHDDGTAVDLSDDHSSGADDRHKVHGNGTSSSNTAPRSGQRRQQSHERPNLPKKHKGDAGQMPPGVTYHAINQPKLL